MEPITNGLNGRLPDGRFATGHPFARGPRTTRMAELRRELIEAATPEQVKQVGAKLHALALEGDVQAARTWLEFVVGKPLQAVELSGPEGEPLGLDWNRIESAVLAALQPFGDQARFAVAAALRGIAIDAERAGPDGDQA